MRFLSWAILLASAGVNDLAGCVDAAVCCLARGLAGGAELQPPQSRIHGMAMRKRNSEARHGVGESGVIANGIIRNLPFD